MGIFTFTSDRCKKEVFYVSVYMFKCDMREGEFFTELIPRFLL